MGRVCGRRAYTWGISGVRNKLQRVCQASRGLSRVAGGWGMVMGVVRIGFSHQIAQTGMTDGRGEREAALGKTLYLRSSPLPLPEILRRPHASSHRHPAQPGNPRTSCAIICNRTCASPNFRSEFHKPTHNRSAGPTRGCSSQSLEHTGARKCADSLPRSSISSSTR